MLKTIFESENELNIYVSEQTVRQDKGYLTRSERETLKQLKNTPKNFIHKPTEQKKGKPIVTNLAQLRKPCEFVTKEDDVTAIITDLRETLAYVGGLGLSAIQIGINKRISFCRIPKYNAQTKKIEIHELVLINPKIIEKDGKYIHRKEGCLSIPHIRVDTDRWKYVTVSYLNEKMEQTFGSAEDLDACVLQHEIDHDNGILILDRKHKDRNKRKR